MSKTALEIAQSKFSVPSLVAGVVGASSLAVALFSQAGTAPLCSFEALTNNCRMFEGDPIKFPDGTSLPSITERSPALAAQLASSGAESSPSQEASLQLAQREWEARLDLLELLNQVDKYRLSRQAVLYFSNHPEILDLIFSDDRQDGEQVVPWPMDGRAELNGVISLRRVKTAEIRRYLERNLPAHIREQARKAARQYTELSPRYPSTSDFRAGEPGTIASQERNISRVEAVFARARARVEEILLGGRPEQSLTEGERGQLEKIRGLRLRFPPLNSGSCQGILGNAYYFSADNTVNVCPQLLNHPEASLATVLGHEVGHAVDPCNSQFGYWQINRDLAKRLNPTRPPPEVAGSRSRSLILAAAVGIGRTADGDRTALPFEILANSSDDLKYFESLGLLKSIAPGIPFGSYPLSDVYKCLTSSPGGGFREVTMEDMSRMATEVTRYRSEIFGSDYDLANDHQRIIETFSRYPQCTGSAKASQMGEAISDWFGAEVLADFLQSKSLTSQNDKIAGIGFFAAQVCLDRKQQTVPVGPDIEVMNAALRDWRAYKGEHPPSVRRINEVILRHPAIRQALGCKPGDPNCKHHSGAGKGTNAPTEAITPGVGN